nr:hypothetical protein [uncultured Agathobaculum sp.]
MKILLRPWRVSDAAVCAALADDDGVSAEAVRRMCVLGLAKWDIVHIFTEPFSRNRASCCALEKNGFLCKRNKAAERLHARRAAGQRDVRIDKNTIKHIK